jgi:stalled ribosome rescue protein Dom34
MKKNAGLWIDHKKAVLVIVTDGKEEKKLVLSNTERNVRFSGGHHSKTPYGAYRGSTESTQDRRFTNNLNRYYDEVISAVRDAESILIFGPGEAKGEIEKRLKGKNFSGQIVSIETADKMTDRQVAEKIREHFSDQAHQGRIHPPQSPHEKAGW